VVRQHRAEASSPLYRGLLAGLLRQENPASRYTVEHLETHRLQLERFEALRDQIGEAPAEVALAWLLTRPGLTTPVTGLRNAAEVDSAARAVELRLPGDVLTALDEIFPGRKTAPEQYAW
jgi:aryl-alcohol dehydrogenase-like predicted oxidoreductase